MQRLRRAGFYQIKKTTAGAMLYQLEPSGPALLGRCLRRSRGRHAAASSGMCEKAPPDLHPYCTDFVVCAMFDIDCPV